LRILFLNVPYFGGPFRLDHACGFEFFHVLILECFVSVSLGFLQAFPPVPLSSVSAFASGSLSPSYPDILSSLAAPFPKADRRRNLFSSRPSPCYLNKLHATQKPPNTLLSLLSCNFDLFFLVPFMGALFSGRRSPAMIALADFTFPQLCFSIYSGLWVNAIPDKQFLFFYICFVRAI